MKVPTPFTSRADHVEHLARIMRDRAYPEFAAAPPPLWATDAADAILREFESLYRAAASQGDSLREAIHERSGVLEYVESERRLVWTDRTGPREYGASAIVAENVLPWFGRMLDAALDREAGR